MKKLRIGVLSCANIAYKSVIPAIRELNAFELKAVAGRDREKADSFAAAFACEAEYSYEALLARTDLDAVYLPLPTGLHEAWVLKALDAGKHVLVEKSFALNLESAQRMVDRARETNLLLLENFMFLHHGQHQLVQEIRERDEIGKLKLLRATFCFPPLPADNFRYSKALGGGALLDAGCYLLRASSLFLGNGLKILAANLTEGIQAQLYFGFDGFYQCSYELTGTKGKITAKRAYTAPKDFTPEIVVEKESGTEMIKHPAENHFKAILDHFAKTATSGNYESAYAEILEQARLIAEVRNLAQKPKR